MKYTDIPLLDTWKALEECVQEGLIKAIGLSNFNSEQIQAIMDGGTIAPAVLQVEIHPFHSNGPLVEWCATKNIVVTAYSPLGSGAEINGERVIDNAKLKEIGAKYGKSPAQLTCAWLVNRGIVVIPKSVKESRLIENLDVRFVIAEEDMKAIGEINGDVRAGWGGPLVEGKPRDIVHSTYPFKFEDKNPACPAF